MAEFCVDCWNKLNEQDLPASKYILSREPELCEECGMYKPVVIMKKKHYYRRKFQIPLLVLYVLWRMLILPLAVCKHLYCQYKKRAGS